MVKANSMKMYAYEELNLLNIIERSFTIKGKDKKDTIIFTSKEITQVRGNYDKGYFIIEGKMTELLSYIKTAKIQDIKDLELEKEIIVKWSHKGNVREYRFIGRCVFYYESFNNSNQNYFEMVFQESSLISVYSRFIRAGDFYLFVEIIPDSMKNISKSDIFWAESGIVLGTAGIIGGVTVILTGAISIGVVVTVLYGVNTVASSTVDMTFCFSGNSEKLGSFNFIRDSVFGNIGQFFADKYTWNKNATKNFSNIAYFSSELFLGYKGVQSVWKEMKTGWKIGKAYTTLKTRKIYVAGGRIPENLGTKERDYLRFGYHLYQIFDNLRSGKGYVLQIYKEAKEIETKSKVKFTNSSAIEVLR